MFSWISRNSISSKCFKRIFFNDVWKPLWRVIFNSFILVFLSSRIKMQHYNNTCVLKWFVNNLSSKSKRNPPSEFDRLKIKIIIITIIITSIEIAHGNLWVKWTNMIKTMMYTPEWEKDWSIQANRNSPVVSFVIVESSCYLTDSMVWSYGILWEIQSIVKTFFRTNLIVYI